MPEPAHPPPPAPQTPLPTLPLNYHKPPASRPTRLSFILFCLSILSLAFMATSYLMYRNVLGFNHRPIQLWIAWASIALGSITAALTPFALYFHPGKREIAALLLSSLYWITFWLLG